LSASNTSEWWRHTGQVITTALHWHHVHRLTPPPHTAASTRHHVFV
jgi:hypothetical protein